MKADLSVGSPAPSLAKASWIQGTPLSSFRPGKMHIVIVFGTRCGYCPGALIAMERLQEKYKDIGVELIGFANDKAATADAARARVDEWLSENIPNSNIPIDIESDSQPQVLRIPRSLLFRKHDLATVARVEIKHAHNTLKSGNRRQAQISSTAV
ncbi:peroxiredoxin family protein [Rhizobium leguminosarum]|uniref:peroxiredoxin family protein n=1 Tax=Rhizobium leguminosarum TaxID=384 RepID=UPI001AE49DC0|nr:redoxin domain-containing protein [Rhizobium leguminosarum]MBP2449381.1 thiol-disulfide isomerase/thioredoxin [Rhizobium leguminosarum]